MACLLAAPAAQGARSDAGDDVEIIVGEDRTVFEYRQNGVLVLIKVVPKVGRPYYLTPVDGSPHFDDLSNKKNLYPRWVIIEW
tara:strand:- start:1305 stop:1553 length:249 start_codon:yes stop_codon:yes gene_type:complete